MKGDIIILSTGYNCGKFIEEWWQSLKNQTYENFIVVAINDCSNDDTSAKLHNIVDDRLIVLDTEERNYALANQTTVLARTIDLSDEDIICIVDLDDTLKPDAIETIKNIYEDDNVWLSYGSFEPRNFDPSKPIDWSYPIRKQWSYSALRTYKWFLYKNIKFNDFFDDKGNFMNEAVDHVLMFPMLEMAGKEHVYYNEKVIYNYRVYENNEYKTNKNSFRIAQHCKNKKQYRLYNKEELIKRECDWI